MGDRTVLQEVEGQLASVPPDSVKHDLQPAFEAMANWIRTLDQGRRLAVTHALPQWFGEHHPVVTLRGWQDDRLQRSGLSLIHAYYCGRDDDDDGSSLKTILTREELAIACPQALTK